MMSSYVRHSKFKGFRLNRLVQSGKNEGVYLRRSSEDGVTKERRVIARRDMICFIIILIGFIVI